MIWFFVVFSMFLNAFAVDTSAVNKPYEMSKLTVDTCGFVCLKIPCDWQRLGILELSNVQDALSADKDFFTNTVTQELVTTCEAILMKDNDDEKSCFVDFFNLVKLLNKSHSYKLLYDFLEKNKACLDKMKKYHNYGFFGRFYLRFWKKESPENLHAQFLNEYFKFNKEFSIYSKNEDLNVGTEQKTENEASNEGWAIKRFFVALGTRIYIVFSTIFSVIIFPYTYYKEVKEHNQETQNKPTKEFPVHCYYQTVINIERNLNNKKSLFDEFIKQFIKPQDIAQELEEKLLKNYDDFMNGKEKEVHIANAFLYAMQENLFTKVGIEIDYVDSNKLDLVNTVDVCAKKYIKDAIEKLIKYEFACKDETYKA